nr:RNA-directed DNA polymerase, eukaryota [Tanacetum cinerariifolium]
MNLISRGLLMKLRSPVTLKQNFLNSTKVSCITQLITYHIVLISFSFGSKWRSWIRGSLSSWKASILVNGSPTTEFHFHRGLKQGHPLAPFLFLLIMESLHLSFSRAVEAGIFTGFRVDHSITLSHLFYADDAVFIGDNMSSIKVWDETIYKMKKRLSRWKLNTLSVGGRLTLLKSVLLFY